jgi:hypothetical protein
MSAGRGIQLDRFLGVQYSLSEQCFTKRAVEAVVFMGKGAGDREPIVPLLLSGMNGADRLLDNAAHSDAAHRRGK